jgi:DNA-3-methyladenine glycosylase
MTLPQLLALPPLQASQALLGWELLHTTPEGTAGGIIVETEAYLDDDPASHSFRGVTPRTVPMFQKAGTIYVYRSYGIHLCMNIVLGKEGQGAAALIRALAPTVGIPLMQTRRHPKAPIHRLCSGPGNLGQALDLSLSESGTHLNDSIFTLRKAAKKEVWTLGTSSRIGISKGIDQPFRFFIAGHPSISK